MQSKGIVLRSSIFKDRQRILQLYTEKFGLVSAVIKGISSQKVASPLFCDLFCEAEFVLVAGKSDLKKFQEASLLDLHLALRTNLSYLKTASSMTSAILRWQLPESASFDLYHLLSSFLKQIPLFSSQETLLGCFYLKLLKHEGLFHPECFPVGLKEKERLFQLSSMQSFSELKKFSLINDIFSQIESVFLEETHKH